MVHAAAGGVGLLLTQMVKRRGGIVVATTSGGEKDELARGAGADHVASYASFRAVVDDITDGTGAHVVYDGVGKDTFDDGLAALRPRGMMVLYGAASGQVPPLDPQRLNSGGSLFLTRPTMAHYIADADGAALAGRRGLRLDRQGRARRADRRHLPAGRRGPGPGGPGGPAHHGQAAAPAGRVAAKRRPRDGWPPGHRHRLGGGSWPQPVRPIFIVPIPLVSMPNIRAAAARRPYEITLLVVAVAAAGLNLRTAITSLPPLFPDLQTQLHLSSATLSLLAATPVICFGVVSAFAAWLNRRFGEEAILLVALVVLTGGLLLRGVRPGSCCSPARSWPRARSPSSTCCCPAWSSGAGRNAPGCSSAST